MNPDPKSFILTGNTRRNRIIFLFFIALIFAVTVCVGAVKTDHP